MAKHTISNNAKCPYYRGEERHEIFCAGVAEGMGTHMAFSSPLKRKQWAKELCKSIQEHGQCPVKRMLDRNEEER